MKELGSKATSAKMTFAASATLPSTPFSAISAEKKLNYTPGLHSQPSHALNTNTFKSGIDTDKQYIFTFKESSRISTMNSQGLPVLNRNSASVQPGSKGIKVKRFLKYSNSAIVSLTDQQLADLKEYLNYSVGHLNARPYCQLVKV